MRRHDFELAGLQVRPTRNVLDDGRVEHPLEPLVMDLLCVLAARPEQVCSRDELLAQLWPGRHGADANLTRCVSLLRKALRDAGLAPCPVETVPKRGYRLTLQPMPSEATAGGSAAPARARRTRAYAAAASALLVALALLWAWPRETPPATEAQASADQRPSLAVLPMESRSDDPEDAFITDALHDEVLSELARFRALKVISRTSVMQYRGAEQPLPQIARALGVSHVLEGAVQRSGEAIRINVQLIDARTDDHVWAQVYERELSAANLFEIQTEIARAIAHALNARLSARETRRLAHRPTDNLQAYQAFLLGRQHFHRRTIEEAAALDRAIRHYERALLLQPDYAEALAGLAAVHTVYPGYATAQADDHSLDLARSYARRALELDPQLAMPHAVLGMVEASALQRMRHLERAIKLEPSNATAWTWRAINRLMAGHLKDGESDLLEARQLDPTSAVVAQWLAVAADLQGNTERSVAYCEQGIAMGIPPASGMLSTLRLRAGDSAGTRELFERSLPPDEREAWIEHLLPLRPQPSPREAAVRAIIGPNQGKGMSHLRVLMLMAIGEHGRALDLIEHRLPHEFTAFALTWRQGDPAMRSDPRFQRMATQLGLHEYWRERGYPEGCRAVAEDRVECG